MDGQTNLKRLYYRSWHRGCKETDLVLGAFAEAKLASLTPDELDSYARLLDENDWDIWNWVTGKTEPKDEYRSLIELLKHTGATAP